MGEFKLYTRREMAKLMTIGIAGGLAAEAHSSVTSRARNLLGLRGAMMSGGKKSATASSYKQDGLKAMWDAIENNGRGVHSSTATAWNEWVEGVVNPTIGTAVWGEDKISCSQNSFNYFGYKSTPTLARDFVKGNSASAEMLCCIKSINTASSGFYIFGLQASPTDSVFRAVRYNDFRIGLKANWDEAGKSTCVDFVTGVPLLVSCTFSANGDGTFDAKMYKDGTFVKSNTVNYAPYNDNTNYMLYKMANGIEVEINCVRFYNRALSADEVAANYAIDKARFGLT